MYLLAETDRIISILESCEELSDCRIIKAYPFVKKPTRLQNAVIAVSPGVIDAKKNSLGDGGLFGTYTINADIFVPQDLGSPFAKDIVGCILNSTAGLDLSGVSVSEVSADDNLNSFNAKCTLEFCAPVYLRGENYEN